MAAFLAASSQNIAVAAGMTRGGDRLVRRRGRSAVTPPVRAVSTASGGTSLGDVISDIAAVPGTQSNPP